MQGSFSLAPLGGMFSKKEAVFNSRIYEKELYTIVFPRCIKKPTSGLPSLHPCQMVIPCFMF